MLCSNLLCFDSDFAVFGILFSCLCLQECSFFPGGASCLVGLVFGPLRAFSMECLLFRLCFLVLFVRYFSQFCSFF